MWHVRVYIQNNVPVTHQLQRWTVCYFLFYTVHWDVNVFVNLFIIWILISCHVSIMFIKAWHSVGEMYRMCRVKNANGRLGALVVRFDQIRTTVSPFLPFFPSSTYSELLRRREHAELSGTRVGHSTPLLFNFLPAAYDAVLLSTTS